MNKRVKELRLAGGDALGHSITQQEAGKLAGVGARTWYVWEAGTREMDDAFLQLFCYKTGIEYHPDMLTSNNPFVKQKNVTQQQQIILPQNTLFLTLTSVDDHQTLTINSAYIKRYKPNHKTKGTVIALATGEYLDVTECVTDIDRALGAKSITEI